MAQKARDGLVSLTEARVARAAAASNGSVAHAWAVYLTSSEVLVKNSRKAYRSAMQLVLRPPEKGGLPDDRMPTVLELKTMHNRMVTVDGYTANYANQVLRVLRRVADVAGWSEDDNLMRLANKVRQVKPHKLEEPEVRCPPDDALERCLGMTRNPIERFIVIMCGRYSLRINEVLALLPADYVPRERTFVVQRSKRGATARKNKAKHRVRVQARDVPLVQYLMSGKNRAQHHAKMGPRQAACHRYLVPWSYDTVDRLMARFRLELGVEADLYFPPGDAWHVLRHWGATQAEAVRGSVTDVQIQLGDKSPQQAERYVRRLRGEMVSEGVAAEPDVR